MSDGKIDNELVIRNVKGVKYAGVKSFGAGAHVIVPKEWVGGHVQVILLEDK